MKKVVFVYEQGRAFFRIELNGLRDMDYRDYLVTVLGRVYLGDAGISIARFLQDGYSVDIRCAPHGEDVLTC